MNTVLIVLMVVSYIFSAVILLASATLGFVSTKKNMALAIALMLFVLPPLAFMWAKVVVPILFTTLVGYGVIVAGACLRKSLLAWKDQIVESLRQNLSDTTEK